MLRDFHFYHGTVLAKLVHSGRPVRIRLHNSAGNASYVIDEKVGIYLKHSTKRMTPWFFSFSRDHQKEILELKTKIGDVVIGLVCYDDGIVGLSYNELKLLLDEKFDDVEWVKVARKPRHEYFVTGKNGKLKHKIKTNDFVQKVFSKLKGGK